MRALHIHVYDAAWEESKHPRRTDGEFGHGGPARSSGKAPAQNTSAAVNLKLTKLDQRVFTGQPVPHQAQLTKIESGAIGEAIALEHLKANGLPDARALNLTKTNEASDLVADHLLIEVKAGLSGNTKDAQKWRATIGGLSKEEKVLYDGFTAAQKAEFNLRKREAIMARKEALRVKLSAEYGAEFKPKTVTTIINPDTKTADLYMFDGFHHRIGWNSKDAKAAYVGSYRYEHAEPAA